VRSPQIDELVGRLAVHEVQTEILDSTTRTITGVDIEEIGRVAAHHQIVLHELSPIGGSLEDAYLDLTADVVEYRTGVAA
jgi:ABC-2 type transport system ATP-binding protein